MTETAAAEFNAIKALHGALEPLDSAARTRVLSYVISLLGVELAGAPGTKLPKAKVDDGGRAKDEGEQRDQATETEFADFAELYAAAKPSNNGEKALVVGYWLQLCNGNETFTAAAANKELNNLGHKVANITDAMETMKNQSPQLILQLKKSGNSRQARKLYKVSQAGIDRVKAMISG